MGPVPERAPALPQLTGTETGRLGAFASACWSAFKVLIGSTVISALMLRSYPKFAMIALVAPLVVFIHHIPNAIWPLRRPKPTVEVPQYESRVAAETSLSTAK
jgi:hypothetical protein